MDDTTLLVGWPDDGLQASKTTVVRLVYEELVWGSLFQASNCILIVEINGHKHPHMYIIQLCPQCVRLQLTEGRVKID